MRLCASLLCVLLALAGALITQKGHAQPPPPPPIDGEAPVIIYPPDHDPATVLVTVNGAPIRERDVIEEADRRIDADAARDAMRGLIYDESSRPATQMALRYDVLHTLIERQLIKDQLTSDGITITGAEVDAYFAKRMRLKGQTQAEAEAEIQKLGLTVEGVKEKMRWHNLAIIKLYERHAEEKNELTEDEALQLYLESPEDYRQERETRVSHILIKGGLDFDEEHNQAAKARAEAILARVHAGEDFAELARECSEEQWDRAQGGDKGWSARGHVSAPGADPFGDVGFSLQNIGDVSGVEEMDWGYEIIKLTGVRPERQKTFDEVKEQIIDRHMFYVIGRFWEDFGTQLYENGKIEWTPEELARKEAKEERERKYNEAIERQIAEEKAAEKRRAREEYERTKGGIELETTPEAQ